MLLVFTFTIGKKIWDKKCVIVQKMCLYGIILSKSKSLFELSHLLHLLVELFRMFTVSNVKRLRPIQPDSFYKSVLLDNTWIT